MTRSIGTIATAVAAAILLCLLGPVVMYSGGIAAGCLLPTTAPADGQAAFAALDEEQVGHGRLIVEVGMDLGIPPRGWVVAVATAMQESSLRNLPGGDRDSLGLFQQRPSQGWGTPEQILDPQYAATAFYQRLLRVEGWQAMPLTQAAQAVQRSAYPDAYARHEPMALALVSTLAEDSGWTPAASLEHCVTVDTVGGWTRPLPGGVSSGFRTAARPTHFGVDIPAPHGTLIRAAAAGTVVVVTCNATLDGRPYSCDVDGSPQVSGCGWYLDIAHRGGVVTRYCHLLQHPPVQVGDQVSSGQPIGLIGSSGRSSGPHLHFEVELRTVLDRNSNGLTIERRQVDPVSFFAQRGIDFECITTPVDCQPVHGDRVRVEHHGS